MCRYTCIYIYIYIHIGIYIYNKHTTIKKAADFYEKALGMEERALHTQCNFIKQ